MYCGFAVEFFFIVSGYFMMSHVDRMDRNVNSDTLGTETVGFLFGKIKSFYLELILAYIFGVILILITSPLPFVSSCKEIVKGLLWDVSLIGMTGLNTGRINDALWYLSSMLICMAIIYPLLRKWQNIVSRIILPLASVFLLGYLWQSYSNLLQPITWIGITYRGNLRAFADLGIGVVIYNVVKRVSNLELKTWVRIVLTLTKYCAYFVSIVYMCLYPRAYLQIFCLIFIALGITLTFSGQCVDKYLYNNKIFYSLGKLSLPIYLFNSFFAATNPMANINNFISPSFGNTFKFVLYLTLSILAGLVIMFCSDFIKKRSNVANFLRQRVYKEEIE